MRRSVLTNETTHKGSLGLFIEGMWNAVRTARTIILVILLVSSLALNVAVVAIEAVGEVAEAVFERIVGKTTPRAASLTLAREQVRRLGQTTASNASQARHLATMVGLRERQVAALTTLVEGNERRHAAATERARLRATRKVREISLRISRRIGNDALRNVGSAVGEAVPWIGIGVIAATTALELTDACESMKDLYELEAAFDPTVADVADRDRVCGIVVPTAEELWVVVKDSVPELPAFSMPDMPDFAWPFAK
jgi:hypothetical protein